MTLQECQHAIEHATDFELRMLCRGHMMEDGPDDAEIVRLLRAEIERRADLVAEWMTPEH